MYSPARDFTHALGFLQAAPEKGSTGGSLDSGNFFHTFEGGPVEECIHELGFGSPKQRLHHPARVETQIQIGTTIKPLELFQWTTGQLECCGPIREETLLYFIQRARLLGDTSPVINDMVAAVDDSFKHLTAAYLRRDIPSGRIEDFTAGVSEYFWSRVFDPIDMTASRAQVSFRSVAVNFARKLLKRERREQRRYMSLESDHRARRAYHLAIPSEFSAPDALLICEALRFLTPDQERAFTKLYYLGLTIPEIALAENCTERTVYNRLRAARDRLQQAIN